MGKGNKMLVGTAALFIAALLLVSMAQAAPQVFVWDIGVYEGDDGLYSEVGLKSNAGENFTALINAEVDGIPVCSSFMRVNVEMFKGFPVSKVVRTEFDVSNEVGSHEIEILILARGEILRETFDYTVCDEEEESEEEEEEDWLKCPCEEVTH